MKTITDIQAEIDKIQSEIANNEMGIVDMSHPSFKKLMELQKELGQAASASQKDTRMEEERKQALAERGKWYFETAEKWRKEKGINKNHMPKINEQMNKMYELGEYRTPLTDKDAFDDKGLIEQLDEAYEYISGGKKEKSAQKEDKKQGKEDNLPETMDGGTPHLGDAENPDMAKTADFLSEKAGIASNNVGKKGETESFWTTWSRENDNPQNLPISNDKPPAEKAPSAG